MADKIIWDDEKPNAGIQWDDEKPKAAPKPTTAADLLEQHMGPSDFTKAFASTPARILKSGMQMVGAGDYVPEFVSNAAAEGDKSLPGRIVGDMAGTGGIRAAAGPLVNTLQRLNAAKGVLPALGRTAEAAGYGSAQGALTTPDDQGNAALWGAAGGAGGQVLGRVFSGLVRPTAEARTLLDAGVGLTPGQAAGAGSFAKKAEEFAGSLPVASHFIRSAQNRAVEDANVAAAQAVTDMVDKTVKLGRPPREAIEATREAIGKHYDAALDGMVVPGIVPDAHLTQMLQTVRQNHPMLEESQVNQMGRFVNERLANMIRNNNGTLDGKMMKQFDSEIGQQIRNFVSSTNAADKTAAPAWRDMQQVVRDVMETAHPDPQQSVKLQQANAAYRQLLALEKAMLPGNEVFTPRRLRMTLDKMDINSGELRDLSNAMSATLPNQVPSSGSIERLLMGALPATLMGGGAGAQSMGLDTLGTGMMAAGALGSRPGARFLTGGGAANSDILVQALRRFIPAMSRPKRDK